jgi:calcium/calmodulin-dependent protein kinase I
LKANYQIDKDTPILGKGSFGKVFKTYNKKDPSIKVAIKVLDKKAIASDLITEEVAILAKLDHPNIVNHLETYDDKHYVYIGKYQK